MRLIISVAIASYNGKKYIIQLLESIMTQSAAVGEVIINDDCSTDNTVELVQKFIDKNRLDNWKVNINKKNLGFSLNFFQAAKQTNGNIIFIADQDDVWEKNKVEIMTNIISTNNKVYLLSSLVSLIDAGGKDIELEGFKTKNIGIGRIQKIPFDFFVGNSSFPGCTMCIRKEIRDFLITYGSLDLNLALGHDWYFSIVASLLGDFYHLNKPLVKRRIHENNISLGRLRKKTILTTTNEKRNDSFKQIIVAHQFILDNNVLKSKLTKQEKNKIEKIILFFKNRLRVTESRNILSGLKLLFSPGQYYQCAKSFSGAFRLLLADIFYAYNINWKLNNNGRI